MFARHKFHCSLRTHFNQSQKLRVIGLMTSSIIHDLKNTFSVIGLGSEDSLESDTLTPRQIRAITNIKKVRERSRELMDSLLKYLRQEMDTTLEPHDLNLLLEMGILRDLPKTLSGPDTLTTSAF